MPTIRRHSQTPQSSVHSKEQMRQMHKEDVPRDDISGAFAGRENEALGSEKPRSTNVKERSTKKSKERVPRR